MTPFRVLDAAVPEELNLWKKLLQSWPGREVMAEPDYVKLFARQVDRVLCAVTATGSGGILFPFILRPLAAEAWTGPDETCCDIVNPYGYGGAFAWFVDANAAEQFWDHFDCWAGHARVVTSFARLSLFPEERLRFRGEEEPRVPNVVRSLDLTPAELWRDYAHKVRKNVNKARRCGLSVRFDTTGELLDGFLDIYHGTLDRRSAAQSYYFNQPFFESLVEGIPGQFVFAHVFSGSRLVATELVLVSATHLYSLLGGTRADAFDSRPNDLLKHAVIEWGMARRKTAYVLGGGKDGADGIFRYKLSFAPRGAVTFTVGKRVHDERANERLVRRRERWEQERGNGWHPSDGFFPLYRA